MIAIKSHWKVIYWNVQYTICYMQNLVCMSYIKAVNKLYSNRFFAVQSTKKYFWGIQALREQRAEPGAPGKMLHLKPKPCQELQEVMCNATIHQKNVFIQAKLCTWRQGHSQSCKELSNATIHNINIFDCWEPRTNGWAWSQMAQSQSQCNNLPTNHFWLLGTNGAEGCGSRGLIPVPQAKHSVWSQWPRAN